MGGAQIGKMCVFFPLPCVSLLFSLSRLLYFITLVLSFSLLSLSCHPVPPLLPSGCWSCMVSGNQRNWPGAPSQGLWKSNEAIFSAAYGGVEMGRSREERKGNQEMVVSLWRRGLPFHWTASTTFQCTCCFVCLFLESNQVGSNWRTNICMLINNHPSLAWQSLVSQTASDNTVE